MLPTLVSVSVAVLRHVATTTATLTHGAARVTARLAVELTTLPAPIIIRASALLAHQASVVPSVVVPSEEVAVPLVVEASAAVIARLVVAVTSVAADAKPRSR